MIDNSIKTQISEGNCLYYLSNDSFYIAEVAKDVFTNIFCVDNGFECERYSVGSIQDIIAKASTPSFFSEKKLIIIDKFTSSLDEKDKIVLKKLKNVSYNDIGFCLLILDAGNNFSQLVKHFTTISLPKLSAADYANELKDEIAKKGLTAELSVCAKIYDLSGQNIDYAQNEMQKLVYYCIDNGKISLSDTEIIVTPNIEKSVFALTNCLSKCYFSQAVVELNLLLRRNISYAMVLSALMSNYRRMMFCLLSKQTPVELAKVFGVKEYAITVALDNAKAYSQVKLKQIVEHIIKCEYEFKSGVMKEEQALCAVVTYIISIMNIKNK